MLKISLINMPFAALQFPSIALTQLRAVAKSRFGERVRVQVHYLNHEFARYFGVETYQVINGIQATTTGLGDWRFRSQAFPELPDNTDAYFQRYLPQRTPAMEMRRRMLREKRAGLDRFMEGLVGKYRLAGEDIVGFTTMFSQNTGAVIAVARPKSLPIIATAG